MSIPWALTVPVIVFVAFVAPIWIFFHYVTQWKRLKAGEVGAGQVAVDREELRRLHASAERLEQRIDSLESILDREFPDWKP